MKKLLAALLSLSLSLSLVACVPTSSQAGNGTPAPTNNAGTPSAGSDKSLDVVILTAAAREKDANVIRDLLVKAGMNPIMNIQPDFSSVATVRATGEWDIAVGAWTISPGNADYALRPLYMSDSTSNSGGLADPVLDDMINAAAKEPIDVAWDAYAEIERYMVEENAYVIPLYAKSRNQALNSDLIDPESAPIYQTLAYDRWNGFRYWDDANNETRPLNLTSIESAFTSFWLPRHEETYSAYFTDNMYITLITRTMDGELVSDGGLSYNYAAAENSSDFYFVLRDGVTYAKIEDGAAVDTGVIVSADDVVYSLMNAKDPDCCPSQRIYNLYNDLDEVTVVTDLDELKNTKMKDGTTVFDALSADLPAGIDSLTAETDAVDNDGGVYQVVKVSTYEASPQILYYLANTTSGIYNRASVEAVMGKVDLANYNPDVDVIYGDRSTIMEGPNYDNYLWCSGPYIPVYMNEYEVMMEKNPGYFPGTEEAPTVKNVCMKFINNYDTAVASFRSGEIDIITWVPENYFSVLDNQEGIDFQLIPALNTGFITFNQAKDSGRIFTDVDARKAVLYAMDQNAFIATYDNTVFNAYSPISVLYDSPNTTAADPAKVQEHIAAYMAK